MANMASACALMSSGGDGKMLFGPASRWRARQAANTCMLVTISAVSVCVLVVCGVLLVREYSLARAYIETTCTVRNVTYTGSDLLCTYCSGGKERIGLRTGKLPATTQDNRDDSTYHSRHISTSPGGAAVTIGAACVSSQFPCIRVLVVYEAVDGVHYEAVLHPDSLQAAGLYSQCSYDVCLRDRDDNRMAVERYSTKWRTAQRARLKFTCFYNTVEFSDVIVEKVYSESDVIHSMLWPSLVIVVCCAVFLRLETRRRRLTFCGRRSDAASLLLLPPPDVALENSAQINAFGDGNNQPPPAPPPTPLLLAQVDSGQLLTGATAARGHRSPCRRQASLPSNFAGNLECPMLDVPRRSEMAADNHNTTNVRLAIKSWSSSLALRGCDVDDRQSPSCNDHDNGLLPVTVAIRVSSDDDNVNHDVATASNP